LTPRRGGLLEEAEQTLTTVEVTRMMLFDPFAPLIPRTGAFLAPVDVAVGERDVVLTFDLPGLKADDLDIQVLDRELVVRGERTRPNLGERGAWAHAERPFGAFERRIQLPDGVDADAITANMDAGVLSLIVPKPERLTPKSIQIGGGAQRELETSTT
jgi:HSP20 family protein